MQWFRLYVEIKDDPKMLELDDHQFRVWISLLAMAGEAEERGVIPPYRPRGLAAALHTTPEQMETAFALFAEMDMIGRREDGSIVIKNFIARQYDKPSDIPEKVAERKARMKQNEAERGQNAQERAGTPEERGQNAQERLYSDSDSDSENTNSPPNPQLPKSQAEGNGAAVLEFAQRFRDKHGGEGPHITAKHSKALALLRGDLGAAKYGEALSGFFADAWASEMGHSAGIFVGSSMDRWRHTQPPAKNGGRGSPAPAGKSALAHAAEAEEARLNAILENAILEKGNTHDQQRLQ